jgi:hypothetical protein
MPVNGHDPSHNHIANLFNNHFNIIVPRTPISPTGPLPPGLTVTCMLRAPPIWQTLIWSLWYLIKFLITKLAPPLLLPLSLYRPSQRSFVKFGKMLKFYVKGLLPIGATSNLKGYILSPVRDCLFKILAATLHTRMHQKVSGIATWSENCKWYSSLPLGAIVSLFCESV